LNQIKIDTKRIKKRRDHISHCIWAGEAKDGVLYTTTRRNDGTYIDDEITLNHLREIIFDTTHLTRRLMAITHAGGGYPDFSFPLAPEEELAIRNFRDQNFQWPKKPKSQKCADSPRMLRNYTT
ncbi:MAG: hypothetical protein O3A84_07035, partial [Proteobacteria bacterium]|nr:hypothetical protein [Pseudomonadota bacterium]